MEENIDLEYKSHCKINLGLSVLNKRNDGLHNLESIFVELDLHDSIVFKPADSFSFSSNIKSLKQDSTNTVIQAYEALHSLSSSNQTYAVHLTKNIPMGAGLGGGSSNAAVVLNALNNLWHLNLSHQQLMPISSAIGSDVSFFLKGGNQYIEGKGDILSPLNHLHLSSFYLLLVYPNIHINTGWAYQSLKKGLEEPKTHNKFLDSNNELKWELLDNDFENVVFSTYPEIGKVKDKLISRKVLYAGLSGSGSTVYGIFTNKSEAIDASRLFPSYNTYISSPIV